MTALAGWYPGDRVVFAGLELLGMVTVLVGLIWAVESVVARHRAALRNALWTTTLVGVMLAPAWVWLGRQMPWRVAILPRECAVVARTDVRPPPTALLEPRLPDGVPAAVEPRELPPVSTVPATEVASAVPTPVVEMPSTPVDGAIAPDVDPLHVVAVGVIGVWALGSVYLSFRLLHGWLRVRRLWGRVRPLGAERWGGVLEKVAHTLSVDQLPAVCVSPDVRSPLVAGLFAPCVLLPASLLDACAAHQLEAVLVHECAHVVRRDPWGRLLQRLAVILYWVHPFVYLLNRKLDQAREEVCDNHVLALTEPIEYAETLLTVAQLCHPVPSLEGYLTMLPRHHNLETRVANLLHDRRDKATRLPTSHRVGVVATLVLAISVGSSVGFQREASAADVAGQTPPPMQPPAAAAKAAEPAATGTVTGRVMLDADERPVSGADVLLQDRQGNQLPWPTRHTTANAQGEFTFDAVPPGKYRVLSFHDDLASRSKTYEAEAVVVPPNGAALPPVVLRMRPGIPVRVKVISQADGKPIAGARVRLIWTDTDRDHFTDITGVVKLPPLTPDTWHVDVVGKDCAKVIQVLNLAAGQPTELEVTLPPGGSLEGVVRDDAGRPLAGVDIADFREDYMRGRGSFEDVTSDAEGRYRLDNMPLGLNLTVMLGKLDHLSEMKAFRLDATAARQDRQDFVLKRRPHGGTAQGVVADEQGRPIAGAELVNKGMGSWEVRKATTDAQGNFLLDNVYARSGGHQVMVRAKGFSPQDVSFTPGPAAQPAELTVTLTPGHRLDGRVVNEAGKPLAGVRVFAYMGRRPTLTDIGVSATTDTEGRFRLDSLPASPTFNFMLTGYTDISDTTLPLDGDKEVVVTMKATGVVKGRVVDATTGRPVPRFAVSITISPDRRPGDALPGILLHRTDPGEEFVSADGRYLLKDLTVGAPLQVSVTAAGHQRQVIRRVVVQPESDAAVVEIRLTADDPG